MSSILFARIAATFCSAPIPIGSIASRSGKPIATPAARRNVRRFSDFRIERPLRNRSELLVLEHTAVNHIVDQRTESVILLPGLRHQLLHQLSIGKLNLRASSIDDQLLNQIAG